MILRTYCPTALLQDVRDEDQPNLHALELLQL
jgi:hypothetical protein